MAWWTDKPIAHRGLHELARGIPENSLAAFTAAVAAGDPIELDATLCAEGVPVVFHDADLLRLTGQPGRVRETPLAALRRLRLQGTGEVIPTLAEVLELVGGRVPILLELKKRERGTAEEEAVWGAIAGYGGLLAIQSFSPLALAWFRHHAPALPRGQIACAYRGERRPWPARFALANLLLNHRSRPDFIAYNVRDLPRWRVARLRRSGLAVLGWTVRTSEEARRARKYCDNIIFEGFRP